MRIIVLWKFHSRKTPVGHDLHDFITHRHRVCHLIPKKHLYSLIEMSDSSIQTILIPHDRPKRSCVYCGTEFNVRPSATRKFCSRSCYNAYKRGERNGSPPFESNWELIPCKNCGELFSTGPGLPSVFCSLYCLRTQGQKLNPLSRSISKELRNYILNRDGVCCRWCGSTDNLEIDHIWPVSKGGPTIPDNLQVLCVYCNSHSKRERITKKALRIIPSIFRHHFYSKKPLNSYDLHTSL